MDMYQSLVLINTLSGIFFALMLSQHIHKEMVNGTDLTINLIWTPLHIYWMLAFIIDWISVNLKARYEHGLSVSWTFIAIIIIVIETYAAILALDPKNVTPVYALGGLLIAGIVYDLYYIKMIEGSKLVIISISIAFRVFILLSFITAIVIQILIHNQIDLSSVLVFAIMYLASRFIFAVERYRITENIL
ncbi:MAG: hypothetical protein AB2599_16925 [Candidatus Thiodiazotropha sp.]